MNKVFLIGRLTKDPEVRYTGSLGITRYTLAVDRKKKGEADFINCVTFEQGAEFAAKYLKKGMKIAVIGRIQTGSYTNKDGKKVYTTDIVVEEHEFAEKKNQDEASEGFGATSEGFMDIPEGEGIPFA